MVARATRSYRRSARLTFNGRTVSDGSNGLAESESDIESNQRLLE